MLGLLSALVAAQSHAAKSGKTLVRQIILGKTHSRGILIAKIYYVAKSSESGIYIVAFTDLNGQGKQLVRNNGAGLPGDVVIDAQDYARLGRKQLFISSPMGAVYTHIYDFDGKRVRELYSRNESDGRVDVEMVKRKNGQWRMVEYWPRSVYEDQENLGVGYSSGKQNDISVGRCLHWSASKSAFIPDHPGASIVKMQSTGHKTAVHLERR
jgi:hypothetical protein